MSNRSDSGQAVLILGAGHGRRMGGPKIFARYQGRTFLGRILERCRECEARVVLVSDPEFRTRLETLLAGLPAPFPRIVEADGNAPMLESVRAGLRAGPFLPGFWIWPVDAPFLSSRGWRKATAAVAAEPEYIWKLRHTGKTGHPVWFPADAAADILTGNWPDGLRGFLGETPPERFRLLTLENEILEDFNFPEQLKNLTSLDES